MPRSSRLHTPERRGRPVTPSAETEGLIRGGDTLPIHLFLVLPNGGNTIHPTVWAVQRRKGQLLSPSRGPD